MKTAFHIGIWLAVLVGGILTVGFVFRRTCQGGTGNGAGIFHYSYDCVFYPVMEGDPSIGHIDLEGQAPKRFKIYGGVSPVYDIISMKWSLNPGYAGRPEGKLSINLAKATIDDEGRSVPLDSDHLLRVIEIPDRPANRATLRILLDTLEDCHTGQLPKPSHFSYTPQQPMLGRIRHVALGYMVDYFILTWVGIWILLITVFYTKKRITRQDTATATSHLRNITRNMNHNSRLDARPR